MTSIWITSDTHFSHQAPFLYKPRGFSSVKEMNEAIVENWNKVIKEEDIIYHLGDLALSDNIDAIHYINQLKGTIVWIRGNHCTINRVNQIQDSCNNIHLIGDMNSSYSTTLKVRKFNFYLSHYPTLTGNMDDTGLHRRVISLHGHTHQQTNFLYPDNPFIYHVGVDSHNCYPVNIEEVITDIKNRYYEISQLGIERRPLYNFENQI